MYIMLLFMLLLTFGCPKAGEKAALPNAPRAPTTQPPSALKTVAAAAAEDMQPSPSALPSLTQQELAPLAEASPPPADTAQKIDKIRLLGQVSSWNKALVGFQTNGIVVQIYGKVGNSVKKGEVLAQLDERDVRFRVAQARLRVQQAKSQQKLAKRDFHVEKELRSQEVNSTMAFENAEQNFANATTLVSLAELELQIAEKALADTQLRAPFDGVISRQIKYLGEWGLSGAEGGAAFEIYEKTPTELVLNAPESLLPQIKNSNPIEIHVPSLGWHGPAHIIRFVPAISETTRTFLVIAQLDKPNSKLVPGHFIEGVIDL